MLLKLTALINLLFSVYTVPHTDQIITGPVNTENGAVIGTKRDVNGKYVYSFKGIPFANPPIGDLRFQRTEPANNWYETYNATYYRPACWQPAIPGFGVPALSEDCLYLNIWTTTLNKSAKLSVLIWVFGGAFISGSGSMTIGRNNLYDGTYLSLRNVVVVTFNYRLGIFGFLYGNSTEAPGNAGIWDQVMAINWTRRNIVNFGGNPNDITLFGESAGSMAITDLIVTNTFYGIRHWFQKAILLSGSVYLIRSAQNAYTLSREYAKNGFNCYNDRTWIECLKRIPPKLLLIDEFAYQLSIISIIFTAVYGDTLRLIPYNPYYAVKHGYFRKDIHILMNHNEMEGALFTLLLDLLKHLGGRYTPFVVRPLIISKSIVANDVLNDIFVNCPFRQQVNQAFVMPFTRIGVKLNPQPIRRSVAYALSDYVIACPMVLFASYIVKWRTFAGKVFQSRLTYQESMSLTSGSVWANVTHGEDMNTWLGLPLYTPGYTNDDIFMSIKMMDLITHLAKTGEVLLLNPKVYGDWPPYCVNNGVVNASYVELNADRSRLGKVFVNRYRGNDGYVPNHIYNCFNFWEQYILSTDMCVPE